ncbi:MAG: hypothetical protein KGO02_21725 [Alphaproteobacteria bacterium]|nr:hypothetical protein [Alphaproteobacteria bacterium]
MRRALTYLTAAAVLVAALAAPADAQIEQADLLVAGRALGFVRNLEHKDPVRIGIVYDPGGAQSAQDATDIAAILGAGLRIGTLVLKPVRVPIRDLERAQVDAILMTAGLGTSASDVGRISRARKIPCITFDLEQVRRGACAIGVRDEPSIEVFLNRSAAAESGIEIAAVFRFMITEI